MNDLEMYREQLALCDDKIIDALVERNSIVEKIMAYKEKYGMTILQPAQEEKQQRRLDEKLAGNKYQDEIEDVFRRISFSRRGTSAVSAGCIDDRHNLHDDSRRPTGRLLPCALRGDLERIDICDLRFALVQRAQKSN